MEYYISHVIAFQKSRQTKLFQKRIGSNCCRWGYPDPIRYFTKSPDHLLTGK